MGEKAPVQLTFFSIMFNRLNFKMLLWDAKFKSSLREAWLIQLIMAELIIAPELPQPLARYYVNTIHWVEEVLFIQFLKLIITFWVLSDVLHGEKCTCVFQVLFGVLGGKKEIKKRSVKITCVYSSVRRDSGVTHGCFRMQNK